MRYLLDTHAFIWFITNDDRLGSRAYEEISNIKNDVVLSIASLWEMAIKVSLGKLELGKPFHALIPRELVVNEIGLLSIVPKHLAALADLPFHHRDPFDRLIIAQAMIEGIPIVSHDGDFPQYPVQIVW
jgi:PIN domain nuclease of toxin-antitoxin system